jgi:hypothetical protein
MTTPLTPHLIRRPVSDEWSVCPNCSEVGHVSGAVGFSRDQERIRRVGTKLGFGEAQLVATSRGAAVAVFTVGGHWMVCPKCGLVCRTCGLGYFECTCEA